MNASSGAVKWTFATGNGLRNAYVYSSPLVSGGRVYVGGSDGNVYAINANTGACAWAYLTGSPVYASPVVDSEGVVYVGSFDNNVYGVTGAARSSN